MKAALRRLKDPRAAQRAAYVGGTLLVVSGGTGAIGLVAVGAALVARLPDTAAGVLAPLIIAAAIVAALGGVSVIVGGYVLTRRRILGKILITLGASVGLFTFALQLLTVAFSGWDVAYAFLQAATTAQGLAVVFVVYAQLRS